MKCKKCGKSLKKKDTVELITRKGKFCSKCGEVILHKIIKDTGGVGDLEDDFVERVKRRGNMNRILVDRALAMSEKAEKRGDIVGRDKWLRLAEKAENIYIEREKKKKEGN